ncbi:AAA family ATPase [Candidatus Pacearchaeota archaeon]|nr:AAA family ATPase [Candidatus Pacearchaeota archaeon]
MAKYMVDFQDKKAVVIDLDSRKPQAEIQYPELADEVTIPIRYKIVTDGNGLAGMISSYLPERNRVMLSHNGSTVNLVIEGNNRLRLKTGTRQYDIGRVGLEDLAVGEAEKQKESGFSHGYKLRSPEETGSLSFYERDGGQRAVLVTGDSPFMPFLPVALFDKINKDLEGKTVKKAIPQREALITTKVVEEQGAFARFVKERFKPRMLQKVFAYQDQNGEKDRLFEYLDSGLRPVILNGPTGNGKTVLARDYANARGLPYYFDTGSSSFRLSTAIGKFVPAAEGPTFSPGSLTLAAIHGGLYVLEEMPPIPQDELTGLNMFLETGELPLITQFGHETLTAHPNFRLVSTGNFHSAYTTNELNDALLQRFSQIKMGYPTRENTTDILLARAPGLDYETAELITKVTAEMRDESRSFSKDLGLKGPVEVAQRIMSGTEIPLRSLFEESVVNPITTYENDVDSGNGRLHSKLMKILDKYGV